MMLRGALFGAKPLNLVRTGREQPQAAKTGGQVTPLSIRVRVRPQELTNEGATEHSTSGCLLRSLFLAPATCMGTLSGNRRVADYCSGSPSFDLIRFPGWPGGACFRK